MSDEKKPYEVEADAGGAQQPMKAERASQGAESAKGVDSPKGRIDAPQLLEGFEEDADFTKDPEVERVIMGKPVDDKEAAKPPAEEFVKPGVGGPKVWGIVGGVLLLAAMIAAGVQAGSGGQRVLRVLLVLYNTLLHTGTGVVAVFVAAVLLGKRFGKFELAAARMFAAVAAFALLISLQFKLSGVVWLDRIVVLILATGVYGLIVASTFNLWKRNPLLYVVGAHFFLWLIVAVGMLLSQVTVAPPAESKPPAVAPSQQPAAPPPGSGG
ncbi:MAG: hypothetical protein KF678_01090 [Phycisphaeraceae bacterium]|nr:hypothetical protein [Phycisphaeraceae bacterium]